MKKLTKIDKIEKTVKDILLAVNKFANDTEKRFQGLETRMGGLETRMNRLENKMVTKDYLDEKLADLRSDLVILARKQDVKFCKLVDILKKRKVITKAEAKHVPTMEPFSKIIA